MPIHIFTQLVEKYSREYNCPVNQPNFYFTRWHQHVDMYLCVLWVVCWRGGRHGMVMIKSLSVCRTEIHNVSLNNIGLKIVLFDLRLSFEFAFLFVRRTWALSYNWYLLELARSVIVNENIWHWWALPLCQGDSKHLTRIASFKPHKNHMR